MEKKRVTWLELFYDLLFVAAIATTTHVLLHPKDGGIPFEYLLKFILMFVPVWWSWIGQTMFINRFGQDLFHQRIYIILQMMFVLVMTASLNTDFDAYYLPFLIGYVGLRLIVVLQYRIVSRREKNPAADYLGKYLLVGVLISATSFLFGDNSRYVVLYTGIAVDMLVPIIGRRRLRMSPVNASHLFERFGLLTLILLGESIVSILAVLEPQDLDWLSLSFSSAAFIWVIAVWWQYFDNLDHRIDHSIQTTGQLLIYGHLLIWMSLSVLAAMIKLLYLNVLDPTFEALLIFAATIIYVVATTLIFHNYRLKQDRLTAKHVIGLALLIATLILSHFIFTMPHIVTMIQIAFFFLIYAKVTTPPTKNMADGT